MSAEVVIKKRGRPKRVLTEDSVVVTDSANTKPKKSRPARKATTPATLTPIEKIDSEKSFSIHSPIPITQHGRNVRPGTATSPIQTANKEITIEKPKDTAAKIESAVAPSPILERAKAFQPAPGKLPIHKPAQSKPKKPSVSPESIQLFQAKTPPLPEIEMRTPSPSPDIVVKPAEPANISRSKFLTDFLFAPEQEAPPIAKKPEKSIPSSAPPMAFSRSPPTQSPVSLESSSTTKPSTATRNNPTTTSGTRTAPTTNRPVMPSNIPSPKGPSPPPKPTELPYEVVRQDPRFKSLSRKYTSLIVAIPILLATSYALYGRYTEQTERKRRPGPVNGGL